MDNPCHTNASCTNTNGSYTCECVSGFTGNGTICASKKMSMVAIAMFYTLHYCGNCFRFTDVDECRDSNLNNCSVNAYCTDVIGSYDCTCNTGYAGDGTFCIGMYTNVQDYASLKFFY